MPLVNKYKHMLILACSSQYILAVVLRTSIVVTSVFELKYSSRCSISVPLYLLLIEEGGVGLAPLHCKVS